MSYFEDDETPQTIKYLRKYSEVVECLKVAFDYLSEANSNLRKDVQVEYATKIADKIGPLIGNMKEILKDDDNEMQSLKTSEHNGCTKYLPSLLLSLYHIVFRNSIEEVTVHGSSSGIRREYLFGGFEIPRKPFWLHVYFLSMFLIVLNWFLIMLIDTAIYRKTTTCNDLNVRRNAYLCFNVDTPVTHGPVDCTDPTIQNDLDVYVVCYLQYFNFPVALSLAYSFIQLIIILIHVSFTFTLWCVKRFKPCYPFVIYICFLVMYIIFFAIYGPIVGTNVNGVKYTGANIFYGERIMRPAMVFWGFITLLLITLLSPYNWLIDKYHRQYRPSYNHH